MASPYDKMIEARDRARGNQAYLRRLGQRRSAEDAVRAFTDTGDITGPDGAVYRHRVYAAARLFDADELRLNGLPADYYEKNPSAGRNH